MAIENKRLNTGNTTLLSVPASKSYALTSLIVCNTDTPPGSLAQFDLHLITKSEIDAALGVVADAIDDRNKVINAIVLDAGETYSFNSEKIILTEEDAVVLVSTPDENLGSPTGYTFLSATVSYLEI